MKPSKIFEVYEEDRRNQRLLFTKNLNPGAKVYNERLMKISNEEFRQWDPNKSIKGLDYVVSAYIEAFKPSAS